MFTKQKNRMNFSFKSTATIISSIILCISVLLSHNIFAQNNSRKQYIEKYKHLAIRQMNQYGIPASIILAQACLESGNGNSRLAVKANNHFGIKCHNWNGNRIYHNDDKRGECFRKYNDPEDSFKDHSEFLKNGRRYQSLFDLKKNDYKAWAHGLKAAGYATNPKYAKMLIEIIEQNKLYQYDNIISSVKENMVMQQELAVTDKENRKAERAARKQARRAARKTMKNGGTVIGTNPAGGTITNSIPLSNSNLYKFSLDRQIYTNNGVPYIIATNADSYANLAKEYNLFKQELLKFNDLKTDCTIQTGTVVYIGKKRNKGAKSAYVVQEGDTMHGISQALGIKLLRLYKLNNMKYGTEAEAGKILNLQ